MQIIETKDNNYTISIEGITLHSKYSPKREAEKFINTNFNPIGTVIIIGAGLGYLYKIIEDKHPHIPVIAIPLNKELAELSISLNETKRKQWDLKENILTFLNSNININNIQKLQILEWEPTSKVFNSKSLEVNNALVSIIRKINGNILTTARFGKLWIKNSIKNYINTDSYVSNFKIDKPIIIVASGCSLNKNFKLIKEIREKVVIFSLSSANMALENNGIIPDITFSTDPGFYSKLHLKNCNGILSMPLTNSTNSKQTVLLLNQGNFFENEIIKMGQLPNMNILENGTVAGTALTFALKNSTSKIYLIGQDLESTDIKSHVSPYSFDNLLKCSDYRYTPHYSIMFNRMLKQGVSYKTYRDWFTSISLKNPNRIYRINSSSLEIKGIKDINQVTLKNHINKSKNNKGFIFNSISVDSKKNRITNITVLLNKWLISLNDEKIVENPLFYLISTSKYTDVNNKALSIELRNTLLNECRVESIKFIKRLLSIYGRKLL